jgi:GT2 family glycosyltransferase
MKDSLVSIIVPVKEINNYIVKEIIPSLKEQTYKNFELIVVPDKYNGKINFPGWVKIIPSGHEIGPAEKRDIGASNAEGEILAFIDDDAYPDKNWLKSALNAFKNNPQVAGVCGPGLTPSDDPLLAKVSGYVWTTWLGAGGAGTYRCQAEDSREVDDYPTFNLLINKEDFSEIGGFDSAFWPGEDTKLCQDLVYKFNKTIVYDPKVKVFHHRRKIFLPHLKQIARYGFQRGLFAKKLPQTSNRIGYWIPSLFTIGLVSGPIFSLIYQPLFFLYLLSLSLYTILLFLAFSKILIISKDFLAAFLTVPAIFATHLVYGVKFLQAYFLSSYAP